MSLQEELRARFSRSASYSNQPLTGNEVEEEARRRHSASQKPARCTDTIHEDMSETQTTSDELYATMDTPKVEADSSYEQQKYEQPRDKKGTVFRRKQRKRMLRKKPKKNIDDIEDVQYMLELFRVLHIPHDPNKLDLAEMKNTAKKVIDDQSSGSGKYSNGTTGFEVIAKAKDQDKFQRGKLEEFHYEVKDCVNKLDGRAIEVLDVHYRDRGVLKALAEQRERLTNTEYNILIAGESSAGKSSLVNLILGEELLAHHVLNTTSTICEVKFGEERKLTVHYEYDEEQKTQPSPETILLETEGDKNCYEKIAAFVRKKSYARVEIFWPHELLQEGVVIIDSPGLGQSDEMDEVLIKYLPNAFAFIYVLDTSRAGGMQKDFKEKLMDILKKVQSSDGGVENLQHLAACSLFVSNKWDQVEKDERQDAKKYVVTMLRECWEGANLNNQIVFMSITEAIKAQEYGGLAEEFNDLLQKIKTMVLKAMDIRLYNHWEWLYTLLYKIYKVTYFFNQEIQSSHQETRERMEAIEKRMKIIEKQEQDVRKSMEERVEYQTNVLYEKLFEHIHSIGFKTKFCNWANCALPTNGMSWEMTKANIYTAIDHKFKEFLIQWENDHQVYAEIHRQLLDEFRRRLNLLEEELQGIDEAMRRVKSHADYLKDGSKISTTAKVFFGATSPLWIPFGVAGLLLSMPVLGAIAAKRKVDEKNKFHHYQKNPREYMEKRSERYLKRLPNDYVLGYAKRQMENTKNVLSKYGDQIPILIEADRKLVTQLTCEKRSQDEVMKLYAPIQEKSIEIINKISPWGIVLCPATINLCDLEWERDRNSCLGEGEISTVYKGKLDYAETKSQISKMNVAVKVFERSFDDPNARFFLNEELKIRDLHHKNILKYYGAAKIHDPYLSYEYKFIFVMKAGRENLRDVIFRNRSLTPAEAENSKLAVGKFINRAMDIAEGLNYIHERGLIHRHLKLENIMVDEEGTVMISDIGIVGRFLDAPSNITYLAPEVLEDLTNRTKEADVYSYGIVLWEMWYGIPAFEELMPIDKVTFRQVLAAGHRPEVDRDNINIPRVLDVMVACWVTEPEKRWSSRNCCDAFSKMTEWRMER